MKWGSKKEVARKGVHLLSIFFVLIYLLFVYLFSHRAGIFALIFLLILLIIFEYVRIELKKKIPLISRFWWVKRDCEKEAMGSEVFFLIGSIICLAIFDVRIAFAAIFMTTFGDLAAAMIGRKFGKHKLKFMKRKSWEGVIAEFIVNIIVGFIFIRPLFTVGFTFGQPIWPVIITMAVVATAVETMISKLEDNLVIPVFSGFAGQIALLILIATF